MKEGLNVEIHAAAEYLLDENTDAGRTLHSLFHLTGERGLTCVRMTRCIKNEMHKEVSGIALYV